MANPILRGLLILMLASITWAQTEPASQPTTAVASQPATQSSMSPDAKALLDAVAKAYSEAKSLSWTGKLSLDFDAAGEQKHESTDFTASFAAPNQFRHEMKDDVLIVSTGSKVYAYLPAKNEYVVLDAPKDRVSIKDMSDSIAQLLGSQNPSLLMAILSDPISALTSGATNIAKAEDTKLGDATFNTLTFNRSDRAYRVLLDPATHFIRQMRIDRKAEMTKRGLEDVKQVDVTFDYLTTKTDAPAAEQFAWSPPRDATLAKEDAPQDDSASASALEGKPAPDFKLTGIDGSSVSLADLKGSAVVLDFWATWCGPCVASLPHINQISADYADKGLKVFAVNLEEPKPAVQKFALAQKLSLPILLDSDGATAKKYLANAIPETVIIGKDGLVKKVFVGFGGDEPLRDAIDAELKK